MRKEGHTKIMAFSLTNKQQMQDELAGISRENILLRMASSAKKTKANSRSRDAVTAKQLRHDSDEESEQGYNMEDFDSDADSQEPEGPNGRAATPADSEDDHSDNTSDTSLEDEAKEDNALEPMELDEDEQARLEADTAGIDAVNGFSEAEKKSAALKPTSTKQTERIMTAQECREHIRRLFQNENEICQLIYGSHGPLPTRARLAVEQGTSREDPTPVSGDLFFLDVVTVPPSRFRPPASMGDMTFESPQNELLSNVVGSFFRAPSLKNAH